MGSISLFILPVNSTLTDVLWSWIYSQTNPRKQKSCRLWVGNCLHLFHNHPDARRHTHGEEEDEEEKGQEFLQELCDFIRKGNIKHIPEGEKKGKGAVSFFKEIL